MALFALSSSIREAVKMSIEEKPLDHMVGVPTTQNMDLLQEQVANMMAGVRTMAKNWTGGKYG